MANYKSKKRCMVFETLGNVGQLNCQKINEGADQFMRLSGTFGVCGIKNDNNRIYSRENYGKMVECLQNDIKNNGVLGELEHPNSMNINLDNVSHMIESIEMNEDGTVTGTIKLLNTVKGKNAQAIIEGGAPLFISSRGAGSIDESGHVTLSTIKTYDLVGTPGFSQAKLQLNENQTMKSLNENLAVIFEDDEANNSASLIDDPSDDVVSKAPKKDDVKDEPSDDEDSKTDDPSIEDVKRVLDYLKREVKNLKKENDDLKKDVEEAKEGMVDYGKIQEWITEEYTPNLVSKIGTGVEKWVREEYGKKVKGWVCEKFAPQVQNWILTEYTPKLNEWLTTEYANVLEGYMTDEFGKTITEWYIKECAPMTQKWIVEQFAPVVDEWVTNESSKEIVSKVNENVSEYLDMNRDNSLENIDRMLESIENLSSQDEALQMLKESKCEDKYANVYAVKHMPDEYLPSWNMLSEARKEEIVAASQVYNFAKEGVLENFWAGQDFAKVAKADQPVVENKVYSQDRFVNNVVAQMKAMHV